MITYLSVTAGLMFILSLCPCTSD